MTSPAPDSLQTQRLLLRRLNAGDATALFKLFSDPAVTRHLAAPPMTDLAQAERKLTDLIALYSGNGAFQLAVDRIGNSELIGTCTIWNIHAQNRRGEIGYVLAQPHWGKGYMHEALTALVDHAFGAMQLHRLEADIDPRNAGSARSLERLGFQKEGLLRERWIVADEISDSALYGLLASEWRASAPMRATQSTAAATTGSNKTR